MYNVYPNFLKLTLIISYTIIKSSLWKNPFKHFISGDNFQSSTFRGRFDEKIYAPTALEFIDLSHNKIETLDANTFEHTPYLTTLSLVYNPITTMDGNTISAIGSVISMEVKLLSKKNYIKIQFIVFISASRFIIYWNI